MNDGAELSRPYFVRERRRGLRLIADMGGNFGPIGIRFESMAHYQHWVEAYTRNFMDCGNDHPQCYAPACTFDTWVEAERWLEDKMVSEMEL